MSLLLQAVLVVIKDPRFVPFYAHFIFAVVAARGCRCHRPTDSLPYTKMLLDDLLEKNYSLILWDSLRSNLVLTFVFSEQGFTEKKLTSFQKL